MMQFEYLIDDRTANALLDTDAYLPFSGVLLISGFI